MLMNLLWSLINHCYRLCKLHIRQLIKMHSRNAFPVIVMHAMSETSQVSVWSISTVFFCMVASSLVLGALPVAQLCLLLGAAAWVGEWVLNYRAQNNRSA